MKNFLCSALLLLLTILSELVAADPIKVAGRVTDSRGLPLPGVSVAVSGTSRGVTTDAEGRYTLTGVPANATLIFTFVGMKRQELSLNGRTTLDVTLESADEQLDELVVVGYGVQRRGALTGSVNTVKPAAIANRTPASLTATIQGLLPGVTVQTTGEDVGDYTGSLIAVRGRGNLGFMTPLFVIDGVIASEGDFQRISPSDIEGITVLKDAAASAIYGARAAYGVFVITTKSGRQGHMEVSYNGSYGVQTPTLLPRKLGSEEYALLLNEANVNAGKTPVYSEDQLARIRKGSEPDLYPNTDWYKLFYKAYAPVQEHNLSVSGGGSTRYYVSATLFDQQSLVRRKELQRYSFRANTESRMSELLSVGTNISFVQDVYTNNGGTYYTTDLDQMSPLSVARQSDGSWGSISGGVVSATQAKNNPLRKVAEYGWDNYYTNRFNGSLNTTLRPIKGLEVKGILSYSFFTRSQNRYEATVDPIIDFITKQPIASTAVTSNRLTANWLRTGTLNAQAYATYRRTWGRHEGSLMVGMQLDRINNESLRGSRKGFPSNSLSSLDGGSNAPSNLGNGGAVNGRGFTSQFGRLSYSFDGKYLLGADIRLDRSSQFAPDRRMGVFPSFSAGWVLSRERFLSNVSWLSQLKLRGSWGQLGYVNNVGDYDYLDVLSTGLANVTGGVKTNSVWPERLPSPLLTWETVTMSNLGIEASLLKGALTLQIDAFDKRTSGVLIMLPLPIEYGTKRGLSVNGGEISNRGFEVTAGYRGRMGGFSYGLSGNLSRIWNRIESIKGLTGDRIFREPQILQVGQSVGSFYGYVAEGIFKDEAEVKAHARQLPGTGPGDIRYRDLNRDGVIDANDRTIIGNDVPYISYGLQLEAAYRGFDLSAIGQGVANVQVAFNNEAAWAFYNNASPREYHLKRWTPANPNPDAAYPRLLPTSANTRNQERSSFWLYDASYFRLKSLSLGYTLPESLSKRAGMQRLRIYLSGTNLLTLRGDNRMGDFDPEMPSGSTSYPLLKVYSMGINVSF